MPEQLEHAEHEAVEAWRQDCLEGECDHEPSDDDGDLLKNCPSVMFDTCIDCMDESGAGRDPGEWEDVALIPWPHPGSAGWTETAPEPVDSETAGN